MNEKWIEKVMKVKEWVYVTGFIWILVSIMAKGRAEGFWPPDMIPHPNPPWEQPHDPRQPTLANSELEYSE